jgi:ABC-type cobalamin/Fe3+-siderophores transport system ATPase subunit
MTIPLITVQNLQISQASKTLINKVDFSIHKQDRIILVGEKGSGKSTL